MALDKKTIVPLVAWGGGVIGGIILLIIAINLLLSVLSQGDEATGNQPVQEQSFRTPSPTSTFLSPQAAAEDIFLPEIVIPSEPEMFWKVPWIPYRERKTQWSIEDIRPFWTDPVIIGTETLSEQNRQRVREQLESID